MHAGRHQAKAAASENVSCFDMRFSHSPAASLSDQISEIYLSTPSQE